MKKIILIAIVSILSCFISRAEVYYYKSSSAYIGYGFSKITESYDGYSASIDLNNIFIGVVYGEDSMVDIGCVLKYYFKDNFNVTYMGMPIHIKAGIPIGYYTSLYVAPGLTPVWGVFGSEGAFGSNGLMKRFNLALDGEIGLVFNDSVKLSIGYERSLFKVLNSDTSNHLSSFKLSIGFLF